MSSNINATQAHRDNSFMLKSTLEQDNVVNDKFSELTKQQTIKTEASSSFELNNKTSGENKAENLVQEKTSQLVDESVLIEEDVEEALEIVASFINSTLKQVTFSQDNDAGKMVITMIDKETQEVINQFPSEKIISMAERIKELYQEVESISGLIIDSHV